MGKTKSRKLLDSAKLGALRAYGRAYRKKHHKRYLKTMREWRANRRRQERGEALFCVYHLVNTVTGMGYVGATACTLQGRWQKHVDKARAGRENFLAVAIREYGKAAFTKRVLNVAYTEAVAHQLEIFWIRELRTKTPAGYNMTDGGKGQSGWYCLGRRAKSELPPPPPKIRKLPERSKPVIPKRKRKRATVCDLLYISRCMRKRS